MRHSYYILVSELKRRDHLQDLCICYEGNIQMDLKRTVYKSVDWIHLAKDNKNVKLVLRLNIQMTIYM
jgi:hypothetical protein